MGRAQSSEFRIIKSTPYPRFAIRLPRLLVWGANITKDVSAITILFIYFWAEQKCENAEHISYNHNISVIIVLCMYFWRHRPYFGGRITPGRVAHVACMALHLLLWFHCGDVLSYKQALLVPRGIGIL